MVVCNTILQHCKSLNQIKNNIRLFDVFEPWGNLLIIFALCNESLDIGSGNEEAEQR